MEISKERFEAWLFAQPRERVIEPFDCCRCFLGSFLRETTSVRPRIRTVDWTPDTFPLFEHLDLDKRDATFHSLPDWFMTLAGDRISAQAIKARYTCGELQDDWRKTFPEREHVIPSTPETETVAAA